jgi:hypothetical protein
MTPATIRSICAASIAVLSGSAMAADEYEFDTSGGGVTLNGQQITSFNGAPIVNLGATGGIRTWAIRGDMIVPANATVKFKGESLARVLVGGNMRVPSSASIAADARSNEPGPGGGAGGPGGGGGEGGIGAGAPPIDGAPGQDAQAAAHGIAGLLPRRGGDGGDGNVAFGQSGGTGFSRGIGANGERGLSGLGGTPGSVGINNASASGLGGTAGGRGNQGQGGNTPGGGGFGGLPAAGGLDGEPGDSGRAPIPLLASPGGTGFNAQGFSPGPSLIAVLNGGNGGGGAGGGGGGGGGGEGTTGAGGGGGGGGGGDPVEDCSGGGGGGGGAGASGGKGGHGGSGGTGGHGGGGGGGLHFVVQGRLDLDGVISARGADGGQGSSGSTGDTGEPGGFGGPGGSGGGPTCGTAQAGGPGGRGGNGGLGGQGGTGGSGQTGGAGAGGVVFVSATLLAGAGSLDVSGGVGPIAPASAGRMLYNEGVSGAPVFAHVVPGTVGRTIDFVPAVASPYFAGLTSPNLVPSAPGSADLGGGPGPFGLLPPTLSDPTLSAAIANAPAGARVAVLRYDTGPLGFHTGYNLSFPPGAAEEYDMYVVVNLSTRAATVLFNGVVVARYPFDRRPDFGGPGTAEAISHPAGRAWALLGDELGAETIAISFAGSQQEVLLADPADNAAVVAYVFVPCGPGDFNADGTADFFDYLDFVAAFDAEDESADFNGDQSVDFFDYLDFVAAFDAGC